MYILIEECLYQICDRVQIYIIYRFIILFMKLYIVKIYFVITIINYNNIIINIIINKIKNIFYKYNEILLLLQYL